MLATSSLKFLRGTLSTCSPGGQWGDTHRSPLGEDGGLDAPLHDPLLGWEVLTSQECGSVVVDKVTNSYWAVQDFSNFSSESLKFQEAHQSGSNWGWFVTQAGPKI